MKRPILLIIMDGWGINPDMHGNAVARAGTPVLDRLIRNYPATELKASGLAVGLPEGQMGNSEVGHLNIGAGRTVYQDFTRINKALESGELFENEVLIEAINKVKQRGTSLHLIGLMSDGGVHSHIDHLFALIELAKKSKVGNIFLHAIMDGRDTPPRSGKGYLKDIEAYLSKSGAGRIATVMGRFYAMDRDNRWDRVEEAYSAMVAGGERRAESATEAMEMAYSEDKGDEFVLPTVIAKEGETPHSVRDGDGIIFFNFRSDRAREITRAFTEKEFAPFNRRVRPEISSFVCMTEYNKSFGLPIAFPQIPMDRLIGEIISEAGMKQLRIAETEKYAHVTFFLNGGEESKYPGEERILIPSPKDVMTYDLKPDMSAVEVTDEVVRSMANNEFDLIVLNYANGDMVGHTGSLSAAEKAVKKVDDCIGRVMDTARQSGYRVLITSDHGNAEQMIDPVTGQPHTAHTTNPVPFILADDEMKDRALRPGGTLADIAPTILDLYGIKKPLQMDGTSLLEPI